MKYIKKFGMWQTKQVEFFHLQTDHGSCFTAQHCGQL